jgi:PAS domain S-box-containing protein
VVEARSGNECLSQAELHRPDLILLDIKLPDVNGVEVLKRLRADPRFDHIFIVHLSAQTGPAEKKMQGLELGADGYISQPVENHELVTRVRAFLRHKSTMDNLRDSEQRYRELFESNPEPMWIYDRETERIVAVNRAAIHHYGFSRDEFQSMTTRELLAEAQETSCSEGRQTGGQFGFYIHRTRSGRRREVETNEQEIRWADALCRVVLAHDVTERNRIDREKSRNLERLEREFSSLRRLAGDRQETTSFPLPDRSLRDRADSERVQIAGRYEQALHGALANRIYKTDSGVTAELRSIAGELFHLNATARDTIEIHCETMRKVAPIPELPKAQAFIETGRITLIELLGYLVSEYRQFCRREEHGK